MIRERSISRLRLVIVEFANPQGKMEVRKQSGH